MLILHDFLCVCFPPSSCSQTKWCLRPTPTVRARSSSVLIEQENVTTWTAGILRYVCEFVCVSEFI